MAGLWILKRQAIISTAVAAPPRHTSLSLLVLLSGKVITVHRLVVQNSDTLSLFDAFISNSFTLVLQLQAPMQAKQWWTMALASATFRQQPVVSPVSIVIVSTPYVFQK